MIHETLLAKKINFSSSSMAPSIYIVVASPNAEIKKTGKISRKKIGDSEIVKTCDELEPKSDSVVVIADATPTSSQRILIFSSCYSWLHLEEKEKRRKINKSLDYLNEWPLDSSFDFSLLKSEKGKKKSIHTHLSLVVDGAWANGG
jgi:hypothetical protein